MWRSMVICCLMLAPGPLVGASYDELAEDLVAPCCWKEALTLHRSPAADEARAELRALIDEGKTEGEIRAWFVAKYGERILLTPDGEKGRALFWGPVLAGMLGLAAGLTALRKWSATGAVRARPAAEPAALDDSEWDW
jgi:cytochrome c-type biogenesis protein CcmH